MRLARKALGAGLLGLGICGAAAAGLAQTTPATQNSVPDAPRPQTLPQLNTITPAAPSIPGSPAANSPSAGSALPSAPTAQPYAAFPENGGVTPAAALPSSQGAGDRGTSASTAVDTTATAQQEAPSGPAPARRRSDITVQVNFVEIPFTVKDSRHQLVPGLTPRDVRVYENGLSQQIRLFTADPLPLSVALVIDQSVTFDTMQKINASLSALQGAFTPYDEVAIFTYNNGVKEVTGSGFSGAQSTRITFALERSKGAGRDPLMPLGGPLAQTATKNNLGVDPNLNGNNNMTLQQGQTAPREYHTLNDAILAAAQTVAKAGKGRRRVIYVISDGKEYGSQAKSKEVIKFLQTNDISVYATLVGDSAIPGAGFLDRIHLPLTMRDDGLPRYAAATGGECDPEFRPQSIQNNFAKLAEQVRTQYAVGYYSHEPFIDGKYRTIDVRVLRPNLIVVAKPGYYPSASMAMGAPARSTASTSAPASTAPDITSRP